MHVQMHPQTCLCRLAILPNCLGLASGFPTCGARNAMFCWVSSCDGYHERARWKMWPQQFDYWSPRFSLSCDYVLSLLLFPLTFNHSWVFPIWLPFLTSSVLKEYSESKITEVWGFARQEALEGPSASPLAPTLPPCIRVLVAEKRCWNQYKNKLPRGPYCGGKVSTENPCNQKRGKMRLNWLNWESQKRTTWKISSRTTEKHNPPCMLSRTVPLCYQPLHLVTFCCISTELLDPRQIVKIEKPECQWLQQVSILLQWWFVIIRELHQSSFWKQKEQKITRHYTCGRQ